MPLTLSTFDPVLKNEYLPDIRQQLNWSSVLLSRLSRKRQGDEGGNVEFVGKQAIMALGSGGNEGIGNRADGGTLPTAGNQAYKNATWNLVYSYARIQITGPTIRAARTNTGAYIRAVDSEIKGAVRNLKSDVNRQLNGQANSILTMCGTTSNTTTVTVISTKFIRPGMIVDILVASSGATITNGTQTVLTVPSATTFTVGANVTTSSTHAVYRSGNRNVIGSGTGGGEAFGVQNLGEANPTNGGPNFGGIDRTAGGFEFWKGNRLNNGGTNRTISNALMQQAQDTAAINGEGDISLILTNHGTMRAWGNELYSKKQFHNVQVLKGGYESIPFNNIPVVADKDITAEATVTTKFPLANRLYFLDESSLALLEMSDWSWMDMDGAVLSRVSGQDAYEAILYKYWNFSSDRPNASAILDDITEL